MLQIIPIKLALHTRYILLVVKCTGEIERIPFRIYSLRIKMCCWSIGLQEQNNEYCKRLNVDEVDTQKFKSFNRFKFFEL